MSTLRYITHQAEKAFDQVKLKVKDSLNLFDPVIIFPFRGYGTGKLIYIEGRVLEKEDVIHGEKEHGNSVWNNLRKLWKRYESDEIPGVAVEGHMEGLTAKSVSGDDGYFKLVFNVPEGKVLNDGWHEATLRITKMPVGAKYIETAVTQVLVNNGQGNYGIISDVDDTIIKTSALNSLRKTRIMLTQNARNRTAFEGVDTLYQNFCAGGKNPLFFISGSSWNLYDLLVTYCHHQNIPQAPFFLRNIGLNPKQWIRQDTSPYKKEYIRHILKLYRTMPFILIGDSGQYDPEIYAEVHKEFPDRIRAIYIRHVHNDKRKTELEKMAESIEVPFKIITRSHEISEHAAHMKWI